MRPLFLAAALFLASVASLLAQAPVLSDVVATPGDGTATIVGKVTSNGSETRVRIEYGETASYGNTFTVADVFASTATNTNFSATLSGLKYATAYHFRVVADNADAANFETPDATFTIVAAAPGIVGSPSVSVTGPTAANVTTSINARGATTSVTVRYGEAADALTMTSAPVEVAASEKSKAITLALTGLSVGTPTKTYHYQVVATNAVSTTTTTTTTFTVPQVPLVAGSVPTAGLKATSAIVNATVSSRGAEVKLTLRYGTSTAYGSTIIKNGIPADAVGQVEAFPLTGLARSTTYNYQILAEHSGGSTTTSNATFRTKANTPPVAKTDNVKPATSSILVHVLANDTDADGDTIRLNSVGDPRFGTAKIEDGKIRYTAGANFKGEDEFSYNITDGAGGAATGRVKIAAIQVAIAGVNSALIEDADGNVAGALRIIGNRNGTFTARVSLGGKDAVVTGRLDSEGKYSATLANGAQLNLSVDQTGTTDKLLADIKNENGDFSAETNINAVTKARMKALTGLYTLALPAPGGATSATSNGLPQGTGFIRLTALDWGGVRVQGMLGDGSKFSYASSLTGTDTATNVPLWLSPRDARVNGRINLTGTDTITANGDLTWFRPEDSDAKRFPAGFYTPLNPTGALYQRPKENKRVFDSATADGAATLNIRGGDLSSTITRNLTLTKQNKVQIVNPGFDGTKITLYPGKGLFSGTFDHPVDGDTRSFQGVLIQGQNIARGVFSGRTQTGTIEITPGRTQAPVTPQPQQPTNPGIDVDGIDLGNLGNPGINFGR